jgi:hypothetical protein
MHRSTRRSAVPVFNGVTSNVVRVLLIFSTPRTEHESRALPREHTRRKDVTDHTGKMCDKTLKLTEQSNPPVVKNATKRRRMKFEEIEEWDVVIWDNMSHIAVIEQRNLNPATGKVTMIQSAGEGPISHEYIFTQGAAGSGLFNKTGGGRRKSAERSGYTPSGDCRLGLLRMVQL